MHVRGASEPNLKYRCLFCCEHIIGRDFGLPEVFL